MNKLKYLTLFENFIKEEDEGNPKLKGHNYTIEDLREKGHKITNYKTENDEVITIDNINVDKWIKDNIEEVESHNEADKEEAE
jgi:hypothetical protein